MADNFANYTDTVSSPARKMFTITPHASNPVDPIPKAIRANGAGDICFRAVDSQTDVTLTFAAGEVLDVRVQYVRVAGTTVASIHGLA